MMWIFKGMLLVAKTKKIPAKTSNPGMKYQFGIPQRKEYIYRCSRSPENEKTLNNFQIENMLLSSELSVAYITQLKDGLILIYSLISQTILKSFKLEDLESSLAMHLSTDLSYQLIHEKDQKLYMVRSADSTKILLEISCEENKMRVLGNILSEAYDEDNFNFLGERNFKESLADLPAIFHHSWQFFMIIINRKSNHFHEITLIIVSYKTGKIENKNCKLESNLKYSQAIRGYGLQSHFVLWIDTFLILCDPVDIKNIDTLKIGNPIKGCYSSKEFGPILLSQTAFFLVEAEYKLTKWILTLAIVSQNRFQTILTEINLPYFKIKAIMVNKNKMLMECQSLSLKKRVCIKIMFDNDS